MGAGPHPLSTVGRITGRNSIPLVDVGTDVCRLRWVESLEARPDQLAGVGLLVGSGAYRGLAGENALGTPGSLGPTIPRGFPGNWIYSLAPRPQLASRY